MQPAVRALGLCLIAGSVAPFVFALRALDRREFVAAVIAGTIGWLVSSAGVDLVRPEAGA